MCGSWEWVIGMWACASAGVLAWAFALALISTFAFTPPRTSGFPRRIHKLPRFLPAFSADDSDQTPSSRNNNTGFSLKQDWALIDTVPLYTVNADGGRPATFWTQLSAATPELSLLSPERLRARYEEIRQAGDSARVGAPFPAM